ncbi:hypothetical protein GCM10010964_11020 [Caldovatus sediminis]|uniref:Uncharacterized protein n=1 Tax=Caldovatus sediminis TaxID=2041189 RepID=A0A8J3ECT3_9PROT|nr:hypothetical protein [Caldovatus sediminis]GGG24789.1 hypothetical protein GCM10010964_11020 [Caldovatus sediminis]
MAQQNNTGLVATLERLLAGGAVLFLLLAAGIALLLVLEDPNAPARCAAAAAGWMEAVGCLGDNGYGAAIRLALGGVGVGLFAGLLTSLRSRAEDRELTNTLHAVLAASAEARQRETA